MASVNARQVRPGLLDLSAPPTRGMLDALLQTWPARMAGSLLGGMAAPHDAYTGQMPVMDPRTGYPTDQAIGRMADLGSYIYGDAAQYGNALKSAASGLKGKAPVFDPQTYYHGTASDIRGNLSPWRTGQGSGSALEMGTYVTPSPQDASYWAMRAAGRKNVSRDLTNVDPATVQGANVMPVQVAPGLQKVVAINGKYDAAKFAKEAWKARLAGYDTVLFKGVNEGGGPIDQMLVLNPGKNIRPKFSADAMFPNGRTTTGQPLTNQTVY